MIYQNVTDKEAFLNDTFKALTEKSFKRFFSDITDSLNPIWVMSTLVIYTKRYFPKIWV